MGIFTESYADTLMGYGYMQPKVLKVDLTIDPDAENGGVQPRVNYRLRLSRSVYSRYRKMKSLMTRRGIFSKLLLLLYIKLGTPFPGTIEDGVMVLAKSVLPSNCRVEIEVDHV